MANGEMPTLRLCSPVSSSFSEGQSCPTAGHWSRRRLFFYRDRNFTKLKKYIIIIIMITTCKQWGHTQKSAKHEKLSDCPLESVLPQPGNIPSICLYIPFTFREDSLMWWEHKTNIGVVDIIKYCWDDRFNSEGAWLNFPSEMLIEAFYGNYVFA